MFFLVVYYEPSIKERGMAQLVACLLWEQEVPSSSLGAPTGWIVEKCAVPVAQWIEHQPSKLRVTGSSPVGHTR